jgi:parvulin-like peptidyl-prolyl isomerase
MICLKKLIEAVFVLPIISFSFFPLVTHAKVFDKVAAKINSEIITLSVVEEKTELLRNKYERSSSVSISQQELLSEALNMIIEEKLQAQEGEKRGMVVDEASIDAALKNISDKNGLEEGQLEEMLEREGKTLSSFRNHIRDQIMVSKVSRFEMSNRVKVSDKEINNYYSSHQKEFWKDSQIRARHILFIVEPGASEKNRREKLDQAKKTLNKIREGGDFINIAREYSEDVSANNGGDLGFITRGKMVAEFEEAAFSIKERQVSDIVKTEYGYHIIKVEEILAGKTLTLEESEDRIAKILSAQKYKQGYKDWMSELKKSAFIEVSLFSEPGKNNSMISRNLEKEKPGVSIVETKKLSSETDVRKKNLQKKWEGMYKSVEKSKNNSQFNSLEEKLKHIKKLRNQNTIPEDEYQHRKEKLLNHL